MASKVIEDLYTIRDRAAGARRTIPPCMAERWAEEYSKSGHAELQASTGAKNPDNYQLIGSTGCEELARVVDCYNKIFLSWQAITDSLRREPGQSESSAREIFLGYHMASQEYWALIHGTARGLKMDGTRQWIGGTFGNIIEDQRRAFLDAASMIAEVIGTLDDKEQAEVGESIDKAHEKFDKVGTAAIGV